MAYLPIHSGIMQTGQNEYTVESEFLRISSSNNASQVQHGLCYIMKSSETSYTFNPGRYPNPASGCKVKEKPDH